MKKYSAIIMSAALLASSCTTGAGSGAYAGSSLGSILGSAIGGIAGGPRGSDIGTIVGMAGGAIVGGAIGNAAEQQQRAEQHEVLARRNQRIQQEKAQRRSQQSYGNDYGSSAQSYSQVGDNFDPSQMVDNSNSGDDRIDFGPASAQSSVPSAQSSVPSVSYQQVGQQVDASRLETISAPAASDGKLTIKNVVFTDANGDGELSGGEVATVKFEMYNNTQTPIYNFEPTVAEADGNKRIYISPSVRVENIMPGQGLRYTATVKADTRVKDGQIRLLVSAQKDGKPISYVTVVKVPTVH